MGFRLWAVGLALLASAGTAHAKDIVVKVDGRSGPWSTSVNTDLRFGLANGRPPAIVMDSQLLPGRSILITAVGSTTTYGNASFGPDGVPGWTRDFGIAKLPSAYIPKKGDSVQLNELVGAFIDADGKVVGKPFAIGFKANIVVPEGASALSLGINDDNFLDNTGSLTVTIHLTEASVTVENGSASPSTP